MRNFPILVLLLGATLVFTACGKSEDEPQPKLDPIDELVGTYDGNLVHFEARYEGYYDADNNNAFVATDSTTEETVQTDQLIISKIGSDSIQVSNSCIADRVFLYNTANEYTIQKMNGDTGKSITLTFDTDNLTAKLESKSITDQILSTRPERQVENCTFDGVKQ